MIDTGVSTTLQRIRRQMRSGSRAGFNLLSGALTAGQTTVELEIAPDPGLRAGSELCVDTELMYVRNVSGSTITVVRGWEGSTAVVHSDGDLVEVNPRFSSFDIFNAMLAELGSWGPSLYRIETASFTVSAGNPIVELDEAGWLECYGIARLWLEPSTAFGSVVPVVPEHRILRADTGMLSTMASGFAVRLIDSPVDGTLVVQAGLPFATVDLDDDLVTDAGLAETMIDVLEMGTKARLLVDAENNRGQRVNQGESRDATETPPGSLSSTNQLVTALYRNRKEEEINKLIARYPLRWV